MLIPSGAVTVATIANEPIANLSLRMGKRCKRKKRLAGCQINVGHAVGIWCRCLAEDGIH